MTLIVPSSEAARNGIDKRTVLQESLKTPEAAVFFRDHQSATALNKHQVKTLETRELLIRSAEIVFVRDGYAGAELGEIAALAGRTKGAIYAHFKSKEDIFMALVEEHALRYRSEVEKVLAVSTSVSQNRQAFKAHILRASKDEAWNLLMLEFKLFAIRNPGARKRFHDFISKMIPPDAELRLSGLLGVARSREQGLSRSFSVQIMQTLLSGISLETEFEPDVLTAPSHERLISQLFECIIEESDDLA